MFTFLSFLVPTAHSLHLSFFLFFFNDTATTEIYTLSLHDALPICRPRPTTRRACSTSSRPPTATPPTSPSSSSRPVVDRKSTRLNSSHSSISYAVFCLKKKKKKTQKIIMNIKKTTKNRLKLYSV